MIYNQSRKQWWKNNRSGLKSGLLTPYGWERVLNDLLAVKKPKEKCPEEKIAEVLYRQHNLPDQKQYQPSSVYECGHHTRGYHCNKCGFPTPSSVEECECGHLKENHYDNWGVNKYTGCCCGCGCVDYKPSQPSPEKCECDCHKRNPDAFACIECQTKHPTPKVENDEFQKAYEEAIKKQPTFQDGTVYSTPDKPRIEPLDMSKMKYDADPIIVSRLNMLTEAVNDLLNSEKK